MKKFSYTQAALAIAAPVMLALTPRELTLGRICWLDILGIGLDFITPIPNYTMIGDHVIGYDSLRFVKSGEESELFLDVSVRTLASQLFQSIFPSSSASRFPTKDSLSFFEFYQKRLWTRPIDILDARTADIDFDRTGFDLISDDAFSMFDWDNTASSQVQDKLHDMMAPHIYNYYPNATHFIINHVAKRKARAVKATNGPHMDINPSDDEREAFYADHEINAGQKALSCLMGREDECIRDGEEIGAVLGLWVPTMNTPVCDKPLAVMDSSSSTSSDTVTTIKASIPGRDMIFSGINYDPKQRWYYYPHQTPNEMLLFHHFKRDKTHIWGNPHTGFLLTGCGDEYATRASTEMRVVVFFKKDMQVQKTNAGRA